MIKLAVLVVAVALAAGCGGNDDAEPVGAGETVASGAVPFEQAFIDAMVPHHRAAIEMAEAAQARGLTAAELQQIAADIIKSQRREIDQMLDWREQWFGSRKLGPVLPEVLGVSKTELGEHGSADDVAGAVDVDAKFAEMMIAHHQGAIAMAEAAKDRARRQEVKDLAGAIIEAQEREIEVMKKHAAGMQHG